jgi:signal transduction histidine kinase
MKFNLGTKLFLSYLAVMLVGMLVLVAVAQISLPEAYGRHLAMMNGAGQMGPGAGRGQAGAGAAGSGFQNFRSGFYEALGWAGLAALGVALLASFFVSHGLTAPLRVLTSASRRLADGQFGERVPASGTDELGQLASSFNSMAGKLEQVEATRRRLIGDVAHELRTPLTALKGSMEGLVDGVLPATPATFEHIAAETERLSRLVDDLQELSRVESGSIILDSGPVSLVDLMDTLRKRLGPASASKGISLNLDVPAALPAVRADADRLLQVLTNLIGNALRYTPDGGQVTLSAAPRGREMLLRVADTGVGIPAEHLPLIFDRFYRVDPSRSRQGGGGSGIGLTISRYLVEAQGGRIWAESDGEGQGSTFSFTIPLA